MIASAFENGDGHGLERAEWSPPPMRDRLAWVRRFRRGVAADERALTALMEEEIGRPRFDGLTADLVPLLSSCRWHERHARRVLGARRVRDAWFFGAAQGQWAGREPIGSVGIIATWNYPLMLLGVQLVQAVVAGNRVAVKPSEVAPRTQGRLLDLAEAAGGAAKGFAGLPAGWLTRRPATRDGGPAMLRDERLDHVVFTGSTGVGRSIAEALAPGLVSSTLELSGRDSAWILGDCTPGVVKAAASAIWLALDVNSGQTCMAPHRVLVDRRVYGEACRRLGWFAAGAKPRPMISERAAFEAFELAAGAVERGGRSLSGVIEPPVRGDDGRWRLRPLLIADVAGDDPLVTAERFGPVAGVAAFEDEAEALAIHRACDQHLAASVFTGRPGRLRRRIAAGRWPADGRGLGASRVTINDCVLPVAHPGTGLTGRGASGWGASQGRDGLLELTRPVWVSSSSTIARPEVGARPPKEVARIAGVLRWMYGARALPGVGDAGGAGDASPSPVRDDATAGAGPAAKTEAEAAA